VNALKSIFRVVIAGVVLLTSASAIAQTESFPVQRTLIRIFMPFDAGTINPSLSGTRPVAGSCMSQSAASPTRPDAWRCSAGNAIHDPCFENVTGPSPKVLACAAQPWGGEIFLMNLDKPLPSAAHKPQFDLKSGMPWALELGNGQRCVILTGATAPVVGMRINYGCDTGAQVAGDVDRSLPMWKVFYQGEKSISLNQVDVLTAWY